MTITIAGVDYPWSHPGGAALKAKGIRFACRYLSHDPSKNLSRTEADDLAAHGVSSVVVWETTANRAGAGRAAGIADAHDAVSQAADAGMPSSRPIYFAVDYDANPATVVPYFQGVASVLGVPRTGVYGGRRVVAYLLDHVLVHWAWQTAAWSGGQWDPRTHIRQPATTVRIGGVSCDNNTAHQADYGQWTPGNVPQTTQEDDMPAADDVAKAVLDATITSRFRKDAKGKPAKISVGTYLEFLDGHYDATMKAVAGLGGQVGALAAVVAKLTAGGGITAAQIQAAAAAGGEAGAKAALAQLGDTLGAQDGE